MDPFNEAGKSETADKNIEPAKEQNLEKVQGLETVPDFAKDLEPKTTSREEADKPFLNQTDFAPFEKEVPQVQQVNLEKYETAEPSLIMDQSPNEFNHCPLEGSNGTWTGERGDSEWVPQPDYVPQKSNPLEKTWEDILERYGVNSIEFEQGEPDFSDFSRETVNIDDFSENRDYNFQQADQQLADKWKMTPEEIKEWRKENNYTWHERSDCQTMDLVPAEIHNNVSHSGGISVMNEAKNSVQEGNA